MQEILLKIDNKQIENKLNKLSQKRNKNIEQIIVDIVSDYEDKDIDEPDIRIIQYAEPHFFITGEYENYQDWFSMPNLIKNFAEESYLSYQLGLFISSIAYPYRRNNLYLYF